MTLEKPNAATVAAYDAAIPADPRAVRGQMFGHPCAFVNGNMFFGTFAQTLVARVGVTRAAALRDAGAAVLFEPMAGRAWRDYVQVDPKVIPAGTVAAYAAESLENTAAMPAKVKKVARAK